MKYRSVAAITRLAITVPISLSLFFSACGNDSQQAHETLISWNKALELVEQQRAQHRIPETYVRQMIRAATIGLDRYSKQLPDDPVVDGLKTKIRRLSSAAINSSAGRGLPALPAS